MSEITQLTRNPRPWWAIPFILIYAVVLVYAGIWGAVGIYHNSKYGETCREQCAPNEGYPHTNFLWKPTCRCTYDLEPKR